MPLNRNNTRVFQRTLYAGQMLTVQLLKRNDDQQEGTVTAFTVFDCRHGPMYRTGEPIQGDEGSDHRTTWHIPVIELRRVGVAYLNPADRIVDTEDGFKRYWQPESTTIIQLKLWGNFVDVDCLRIDPTNPS